MTIPPKVQARRDELTAMLRMSVDMRAQIEAEIIRTENRIDVCRAELAGLDLADAAYAEQAPAEDWAPFDVTDRPARATQGSVKPTIERMIVEAESAGVTLEEIISLTEFKPNTVRGTLWKICLEGLATKRGRRWFLVEKEALQQLDQAAE